MEANPPRLNRQVRLVRRTGVQAEDGRKRYDQSFQRLTSVKSLVPRVQSQSSSSSDWSERPTTARAWGQWAAMILLAVIVPGLHFPSSSVPTTFALMKLY